MSREIRRVPARWAHKQRVKNQFHPDGYRVEIQYRPMTQYSTFEEAVKDFEESVKKWMEGYELWQKGFFKHYDGKVETIHEAMQGWKKHIEEEREKMHTDNHYREEEYKKYEWEICSYEDVEGETPRYPNPDDYMPKGTWYQLFEGVSEGTPLSPPFKSPQQLVDWLATNKDFWGKEWTREQAEAMLKSEYSPSMVVSNGKIYDSQEALVMKDE